MSSKPKDDSLLLCLAYLTGHHGRAKSPQSLAAGLPVGAEGFSASLFIQSADRAGLHARLETARMIADVGSEILPCVLLLRDNLSCVLLAKKGDSATIWDPQSQSQKTVSLRDLEKDQTGGVLLLKPKNSFIDRQLAQMETGPTAWFWAVVRENRGVYIKVILASLLINLFMLVSPIYIMNVYDRVIPNNAIETGWALAIGVLIVFAFDFIIRTIRGYFIDFSGRNIDVRVTRKLFDQILDMKLAYRPPSSGAFANMLREFDTVRDFITSATLVAVVDLPFAVLFLLMIFILGGGLGVVVLLLMAAALAVSFIIQIPLSRHVRKTMHSAETKHGLLVETIYGLENIRAMGADGKIRARYAAHVAENADHSQASRFYSALGGNISVLIQQSAVVFIVLIGMYMVKDLDLLMGTLIACVMLSSRALSPITQAANLLSRYHQAKSSLNTLNKIMSQPTERPAGKDFLYRSDLQGEIVFDRVSFAYPGTDRLVLDDVSFTIRPGERVGIVGKIGSGKSTIARLMLKLYDPASGRILIDKTDFQQVDPADLRRTVSAISQDATLIRGTIRDNITASHPHASEEDILRAAKAAGAHDFISNHPLGYDAPVGERGDGLSGGQRQCIALARAFLAHPKVFVCDEPTNAMDTQTEENFARTIRSETEGRTLVLITHRGSLLPLVDRLILLDQGRVVMDDARDKVIAALSRKSGGAQ